MEELKAGLAILQKPYSEPAANRVYGLLQTASSNRSKPMKLKHRGDQRPGASTLRMLKLLDQYMEWLLPGFSCADALQCSMTSSSSSSSSSSSAYHVPFIGARYPDPKHATAPLHVAALAICLQQVSVSFAMAGLAGGAEAAALRPYLMQRNAGTLSVLASAADLAAAIPDHQRSLPCIGTLHDCWACASFLVYPSTSPSSNSIRECWSQAPQLRRSVPAMAALTHWYLQHPGAFDIVNPHAVKPDSDFVMLLVQQLQMLTEDAAASAAAAGVDQPLSRRQQQLQGKKQLKQGAKQAQLQQARSSGDHLQGNQGDTLPAAAHQQVWEAWLPAALKEQVEEFLWGALAAAAAALLRSGKKASSSTSSSPAKGSASTSNPSTATSSTTSSGTGATSTTSRLAWMPQGTGYQQLSFTKEEAHKVCSDAAAALLRLAVAVVPEQQQLLVASADAWMRQEQERFAKSGGVDASVEHMAAAMESQLNKIVEDEEELGDEVDALRELLFPGGSGSSSSSSSSSRKGGRGAKQTSRQRKQLAAPATPNTSLDEASIERKEARVRQLAATGYLCWPHTRLWSSSTGDRGTSGTTSSSSSTTTTTTTTSGSSSSSSPARVSSPAHTAAAASAGALNSTELRLQALAAAVVVKWRWLSQLSVAKLSMEAITQGAVRFYLFMHVSLLLIKQLQEASPQERAAFLHSPAGTVVVTLLPSISIGDAGFMYVMETLVQEPPSEAAAAAVAGQRGRRVAPDWMNCVPNGRDAVELVLLPGLLLAPAPGAAAGAPSAPAGSPGVVMCLTGMNVPQVLVPHASMQLPPGCMPPPAAFFLVEHMLRDEPSTALLALAIKLLRGSMAVLAPVADHPSQGQQGEEQEPEQQQEQQSAASSAVRDRQAGSAEVTRLAYCSLATSVVQAVVKHHATLGEACGGELLALAAELVQNATAQITSSSAGAGSGNDITTSTSDKNHSSCVDGASGSTSTSSTSTTSSSSGHHGSWSLAASLAAALAAGAYTAHLKLQAASAPTPDQQLHGRAPAGVEVQTDVNVKDAAAGSSGSGSTTSSRPAAASDSSSGDNSTAGTHGCGHSNDGPTGASACPLGCSTCNSAAMLFLTLRCLQRGVILPPAVQHKAAAWVGTLADAAQQQGTTLQRLLQQQLLALAWRHPVPGVCGNVLCGRLKRPAAIGLVRNRVRTMCGRCKAAWYCCEACQRAAWAEHRAVCRGR